MDTVYLDAVSNKVKKYTSLLTEVGGSPRIRHHMGGVDDSVLLENRGSCSVTRVISLPHIRWKKLGQRIAKM